MRVFVCLIVEKKQMRSVWLDALCGRGEKDERGAEERDQPMALTRLFPADTYVLKCLRLLWEPCSIQSASPSASAFPVVVLPMLCSTPRIHKSHPHSPSHPKPNSLLRSRMRRTIPLPRRLRGAPRHLRLGRPNGHLRLPARLQSARPAHRGPPWPLLFPYRRQRHPPRKGLAASAQALIERPGGDDGGYSRVERGGRVVGWAGDHVRGCGWGGLGDHYDVDG